MKSIVFLVSFGLLLSITTLQAQTQFGINGGIGFSSLEGTSPIASNPNKNSSLVYTNRTLPSLLIGLTAREKLAERLSARFSSNFYSQKMESYIFCQYIGTAEGNPSYLRYNYLQGILKFDFDVTDKFMLGAGIAFNWAMNEKSIGYHHLEQAWNINLSYQLSERLLLELSYNYNRVLHDQNASFLGFLPDVCSEFDNRIHFMNVMVYHFFDLKGKM